MKEFINAFGYRNFIILMVILGVIVLGLIVLFIVDRLNNRKDDISRVKFKKKKDEDFLPFEDKKQEVTKEEVKISSFNDEKDDKKSKDLDVVYIDKKDEKIRAQKTLEDTAERLAKLEYQKDVPKKDDEDIITKTDFERLQEEKSIISYEELKNASFDIDTVNDQLLEDQGDEPITIEELYKMHEEAQDVDPVELDNPIFTETVKEVSKFKRSDVISPVFGVYNKDYNNYSVDKFYNTMDLKDIEQEIKKTEEFLEELKKIKNKLG